MQLSNVLLLTLGATAVMAHEGHDEPATPAAVTGASKTGASTKGGANATTTGKSKSTSTGGMTKSTGAANSLLGNKGELVTVAGLGVAFAVFM